MKKFLLLLILVCFFQNVFSANTFYWMRGSDVSLYFTGGNEFFMTNTQPTGFSTATQLSSQLSNEASVLGKWYTVAFPAEFNLGGKVIFWSTGFAGPSSSKYSIGLHDFDSSSKASSVIAESPWFPLNSQPEELGFEIPRPYAIKAGNRLMAEIKVMGGQGDGNAVLSLDKPGPFTSIDWNSSAGLNFTLKGVSGTAALGLDLCGASSVLCSGDRQCNDSNPYTSDSCFNAGTCSSYCVNQACTPSCTSNLDCKDSDEETTDVCRNAGSCSAFCSNEKCGKKCSSNIECNDNLPETSDKCILAATCSSFCTNKICNGTQCNPEMNVCGNGICEIDEICEADCHSKGLELIAPKDTALLRGEQATIKVMPKGFVTFGMKPSITISGNLGSAELFDDGKHNDGTPNDNIYGAEITVPGSSQKGYEKAIFNVVSGSDQIQVAAYFPVNPEISIDLNANPSNVVVGDKINITGFAAKKGEPFKGDILVEVDSESGPVFSTTINSDDSGYFTVSYSPNRIDAGSIWEISASTKDSFGNSGFAKTTAYVLSDGGTSTAKITGIEGFSEPTFSPGVVKVSIEAKKENGELLSGAIVSLSFDSGEVFRLAESGNGIYSGEVELPTIQKPGKAKVRVIARKIDGAEVIAGFEVFEMDLKEAEIIIETNGLLESYSPEETAVFTINPEYSTGIPASGGKAEVLIEGKKYAAIETTPGNFSANIGLAGISEGEKTISILFESPSGTKKTIERKLTISSAFSSIIAKNIGAILIAIVLVVFLIAAFLIIGKGKSKSKKEMKEREQEILTAISDIQSRYFNKGMLERKKYYELMLKYESELKFIREELNQKKANK